jgi:hypothetical protein
MMNAETSSLKFESKEVIYEADCYKRSIKRLDGDPDRRTCFGIRNDAKGQRIHFDIMLPPYPDWVRYPLMQAAYFSPDHGGVYLIWRTHMNNFPRWKEIDQQIWRWIGEWNIAKPSLNTSSAKPLN